MTSKTVLERAFELARSGQFSRWNEVAKRLSREGYMGVTSHFSGVHLRRQINELCLAAQTGEPGGNIPLEEAEPHSANDTATDPGDCAQPRSG
ncbi:MAG: hypothetical protein EOP61_30130 [Sphingomonadales bacterium]|nr:MAG: hypothetical protein EOP61_30130 [Sphingomonadales bacterium]